MAKKKSPFKKLTTKLMKQPGMSKNEADAIAAKVGRQKLGVKKFNAKAAAGLRKSLKKKGK
jgi:hypothetical protein